MTAMQKVGTLKANMRFLRKQHEERESRYERLVAKCKEYNRRHDYIVPAKSTESIIRLGGEQ